MKPGSGRRTRSPAAGRGAEHGHRHRTINARARPTSSALSARHKEPPQASSYRSATPRPWHFISSKSPGPSPPAPTPSFSSIKLVGTHRTSSTFLPTSPWCPCRRNRPNSIRSRTSGSSSVATGSQTASSAPMTRSSITAATPGTSSSISLWKIMSIGLRQWAHGF